MPKTPINKTAPDWWPQTDRRLCRLADLPPETARGFSLVDASAKDGAGGGDVAKLEVIVWRDADADTDAGAGPVLRGFVNKCPHLGLPLETFPDRFLSADGRTLICSAHGAQFDVSGQCIAGPCQGQKLISVNVEIESADKMGLKADGDAFVVLKTVMKSR